MAFITAETRSSIVELAMGMLNQAPSTTLLSTLIEKSTSGSSLQDLADYIATTDAFTLNTQRRKLRANSLLKCSASSSLVER